MKLRPRLALTVALLTIPLGLLASFGFERARRREEAEVLIAHLEARLASEGRRLCEESPEVFARPAMPPPPGPGLPDPPHFGSFDGPHPGMPPPGMPPPPGAPPPGARPPPMPFPGHAPPIAVFPYDESLRPSLPFAPTLDAETIEAARAGASPVRGMFSDANTNNGVQVLMRTPWGKGPCSYLVARRGAPPLDVRALLASWLTPIVAMLAAVALGASPIVRRIRELATRVRASAREHYQAPIAMAGTDEVAELAHAFDEAAREVRLRMDEQQKREQTLRDFLANTTHDVMTPLTVLQGHLSTMQSLAGEGRQVEPALIGAAIDEAHYMTSLVHNLGVAARLEAGEPHFVRAPVDLAALVERVVSRHRPVARQHEVEIDRALPPPEEKLTIDGDETFLEQAVSNVVYNAIRYNKRGGHVAVVLESMDDDRFRLRVVDDGPGVPKDEIASIASRSVRGASARTRNPDGRGLGLAIARRVAELHDLELTFAASEYGGLQVDFEGARRPSDDATSAA